MMELFVVLSFLVLVEAWIIVALLSRLERIKQTRRKELQKLISKIVD